VVDSAKVQHFSYAFCIKAHHARTALATSTLNPPRKEPSDMATASENLNEATRSAKEHLARQKDGAASSFGELAGTLRKAAQDSGGGEAPAARIAEWAADGLERVSATLRSNDLNGMVRQVESFARSQPVAFFFAAAAAGFLATRFLKAGAAPHGAPARPAQQTDDSDIPF
jgi:hypothetical protein